MDDIRGSHHQLLHPERSGKVTVPIHGNRVLEPWILKNVLNQATMTVDGFRSLLSREYSAVRYTVLLFPGEDPEVYVAFVPGLDVATQGEGVAEAMAAAREASVLAIEDMIERGEEILAEPEGAVVDAIELDVPVPAAAPA